jgi:beta-1,4-mannooligosaccharide/beta-1,4-mannosyl-N-acetylglucosamine phosphorylase
MAESQDGIHWKAWDKPLKIVYHGEELLWCNDARLTVLDDKLYLSFCYNCAHGERPGIAVWKGGCEFETVFLGVPQQRNMILCPEKINGRYWRLERPAVLYGGTFNIWVGFSPDLRHWGDQELLLGVEDVPFANVKIGGGPPPVRTAKGWLLFFHAVDEDPSRKIVYPDGTAWDRRYTAGAALYDLNDPTRLIAMTKQPILVAETEYETGNIEKFWREDVVFPCGAVLENDNLLRLYYGAGDYSTCMATLSLDDLWSIMTPCSRIAERATVAFRLEDRNPEHQE